MLLNIKLTNYWLGSKYIKTFVCCRIIFVERKNFLWMKDIMCAQLHASSNKQTVSKMK